MFNGIMFDGLKTLLSTPEAPELGPGPRAGVLSLRELEQKLDNLFSGSDLPSDVQQLIRATLLLWHDHLDASHRIAQDSPGADGSYLHGMMHRREPDYGNAKYWFHRVGRHPAFAELGRRADALLNTKGGETLRTMLLQRGEWDPFAFIDACEAAARQPGTDPSTPLLRGIQALEFEILLERFCQAGK